MCSEDEFEIVCANCDINYNILEGESTGINKEINQSIVCKDCDIVTKVKVRDESEFKSIPIKQSLLGKLLNWKIKHEIIEIKAIETPFEKQSCPTCKGNNIIKWDGKCLKCNGSMKYKFGYE